MNAERVASKRLRPSGESFAKFDTEITNLLSKMTDKKLRQVLADRLCQILGTSFSLSSVGTWKFALESRAQSSLGLVDVIGIGIVGILTLAVGLRAIRPLWRARHPSPRGKSP